MSREDCLISYNYFEPDQNQKRKVTSVVDDVYFSSPSDSVVKVTFSKFDRTYHCQVRVASSRFTEIVNSESRDFYKSLVLAHRKMLKRIGEWKQQRFHHLAVS